MLERDTNNSIVAGVAWGLAEELGINVWIIRLLFVMAFLFFGLGLLIYALLWENTPDHDPQIRMNFSS